MAVNCLVLERNRQFARKQDTKNVGVRTKLDIKRKDNVVPQVSEMFCNAKLNNAAEGCFQKERDVLSLDFVYDVVQNSVSGSNHFPDWFRSLRKRWKETHLRLVLSSAGK